MPKLLKITMDNLRALDDASFEPAQMMNDFASRISQGYCDEIENPMALASTFLSVSRAASELAAQLLSKAKMQELRAETERMVRDQVRDQSARGTRP